MIKGRYYALHRPISAEYGRREMWIAESPDLICWGNHKRVLEMRDGMWDSARIGPSSVPFLIEQGWLEIYHGADEKNRYCLGAVLFDRDDPSKVLARSGQPLLEPQEHYEIEGFFGNVVFNCGVLCEDGQCKIYYGAADTCMAYAEISISEILEQIVWF
jgi:predicted GH43/DUF377 family glycosyl hydrolase